MKGKYKTMQTQANHTDFTSAMYALADRLKDLREQKKQMEDELKSITEQLDAVNGQLAEMMANSETQNFTRAGTMFALTTKTRASAVAGVKEELYAALREQGFGDLVYETVNANSLSSFVNSQIEENGEALPKWLEGLVNVYDQTTVSVRKSTRK